MRLGRQLAVQLLAALLAWVFVAPAAHPVGWALLQGATAAALTLAMRRGWGLALFHAAFLPGVVLAFAAGVPAWIYLLAFVLTYSLGRNAWSERVPLYRSSEEVAMRLAEVLPPDAHLLDAGSGDGRLALALAVRRPDVQVTAIESAWGSHLFAWLRWLRAGRPGNLHLRCASFWPEDWGRYDAVYVFLSPAPMRRVWDKFRQQARSGALLISNTFEVPEVAPLRSEPLHGRLQRALLFWCADHGNQ